VLCKYCWDKYIPFPVYVYQKKNIKQNFMPDFDHKNEAFPLKNGFKIKMFKISFERVRMVTWNMNVEGQTWNESK